MDERLLLVRQLIGEGKVEEAREEALKIGDTYWRSYALRWVVEALADDPERAIEVATSIDDPGIRDEALRSLAYLLSKNGRFKEAIEVARRIGNSFLRKRAFRAVGNFLARAIVTKGLEIRLSDLKLEERDLEDLKPLPYGVIYKDGTLMPGSVLHRIRGEVKDGVIGEGDKKLHWSPPRPLFKDESEPEDYVLEYIGKLIEDGNLEEAEKLAKGLPEPLRSYYLEEVGVKLMEIGDMNGAERIFGELETSQILGSLLARRNLDNPELVLRYLEKTRNPATRLMVAYEVTKRLGVNVEFLMNVLIWTTDGWKRGRILKFLAFEMLAEAKQKSDSRLRKISRELFELGMKVERNEGEEQSGAPAGI